MLLSKWLNILADFSMFQYHGWKKVTPYYWGLRVKISYFLHFLQRKHPASLSKSPVLYIPIWISHECQCPETNPIEVTFSPILLGKWLIFWQFGVNPRAITRSARPQLFHLCPVTGPLNVTTFFRIKLGHTARRNLLNGQNKRLLLSIKKFREK